MVLVLLASIGLAPARAQTRGFAILYHERVRQLEFTEHRASAQALGSAQPAGPSLSFVAFGRAFDIDLKRNARLTSTLDPKILAKLAAIDIYEGELRNTPRSWVRLTRYQGQWSGIISDGAELYVVESYANAAPHLAMPGDAADRSPLIYRWSDTVGQPVDEVAPILSQPNAAGSAQSSTPAGSPLFSSGLQIDVGLVGDAAFGQETNGMSPEAAMISMANVVDGIFVTQVGVHLSVTELDSLGASTDPFDATDPRALLRELADYKGATPTLSGEGLVHLFTGRQFPGTDVVGMANLASVCAGDSAVSLSRITDLGYGSLIAAHEIGHNFGAPHDGETGSPCQATVNTYLMSPVLNGSDQFSACSLEEMQPVIASAACTSALPPTDLSIRVVTVPTKVLLGTNFGIDFAVDNHGADAFDISASAVGDGATINSVSYEHCTYADPPGCLAAVIPNDQSMHIAVDAFAERAGHESIDVFVQSINDTNPNNNSYRLDFDVVPAVNLAIEQFDATPTFPRPYGMVDVAIGVSNQGSLEATQVAAQLSFDPQFAVSSIAAPAGACTQFQDSVGDWTCPIGTLAPGETKHVTAELHDVTGQLGNRSLGAWLQSAEININGPGVRSTGVNIQAALADLSLSVSSPAFQGVGVDDDVEIAVRGHNAGPDAASNAILELTDLDGAFAVDHVDGAGVSCGPVSQGTLTCTLPDIAAGADFAVTFAGKAQRVVSTNLTLNVRSDAYDRHPEDNSQSAPLTVFQQTPVTAPTPSTPTPSNSGGGAGSTGGGGGGAVDWLSAALLALALAQRKRGRPRLRRRVG